MATTDASATPPPTAATMVPTTTTTAADAAAVVVSKDADTVENETAIDKPAATVEGDVDAKQEEEQEEAREMETVEQPQSPVSTDEVIATVLQTAERTSNRPTLELELDKVERTHKPSLETNTDGSDEYSSDLGTPLGFGEGDFGESSEDFSSHRFIGPSVPGDDASVRGLHGIRRVQIHAKPPRFVSELATTEKQRRTSSNASFGSDSRSGPSSRSHSEADQPLNTFSVSFSEASALGFKTDVVVTQTNELMVQVSSVEPGTPACRAGVVEGDVLISVNGQKIESHMTEAEVLEIIRRASNPRTMLFMRTQSDPSGSPQSKSLGFLDKKKKPAKPLYGRFSSAVSYGSSILGSKLKRKQKTVHPNSFCDGCGMDPISGALWTCSVCANYNLCSDCYDFGTHGLENTESMQALNEAIVQDKLQRKCKQFTQEFLMSLRRDICKGRPDKFEYMGSWIADIVIGTAASKITVRGIEIPSLTPMSRQRFVSNLMPLVSNRTDIEVNIEWLPDDSERASVDIEDIHALGAAEHEDVEKLRIWISDKKTRTTSPFA